MLFSAKDMPQYYVKFAVTGRVTGQNSFWLDISKIIEENKQDPNSYWCLGEGNFSIGEDGEKFTGVIDFSNCPFKGQTELYRLELRSEQIFCKGAQAELVVTGSNVKWYADEEKKVLLGTGNRYSLRLEENTTFYVTQTHYETESPVMPVNVRVREVDFEALAEVECGANEGTVKITTAIQGIEFRLGQGDFSPTSVFEHLVPGNYEVTGKVASCVVTRQVTIAPRPKPVINNVSVKEAGCNENDGAITINATSTTSPLTYSISDKDYQDSATFTNLRPGIYEVRVKDTNGCVTSETSEVLKAENTLRIADIEVVDPTCEQKNGVLSVFTDGGTSPLEFSLDGSSFRQESQFDSLGGNTYTVYVRDASGCLLRQEVEVAASQPLPKLLYQTATPECGTANGAIEVVEPKGIGVSYALNNGSFSPVPSFLNLGAGSYVVQAADVNGCIVEKVVDISEDCKDYVNFPTAITPNNDSNNDYFTSFFREKSLQVLNFSVFNRWGNLIFHRERFEMRAGEELWNGKIGDTLSPPGVYSYVLEVILPTNTVHTYNGYVQLIR